MAKTCNLGPKGQRVPEMAPGAWTSGLRTIYKKCVNLDLVVEHPGGTPKSWADIERN